MTKQYVKIKGIKIIDRNKRKKREMFIKECLMTAASLIFFSGLIMTVEGLERSNPSIFSDTVACYITVAGLFCCFMSYLVLKLLWER